MLFKRLRNRGGRWHWKPWTLREQTGELGNPYRGTYQIYRFYAHGETLSAKDVIGTALSPEPGQTLALVEVNLRTFREGPLTDAALDNIKQDFDQIIGMGMDMILRFVYDWEGLGAFYEPEDINIICDHMRSLAPLLRAYGPHIFILQGLFTGSWGEMHNTRYSNAEEMSQLMETLYHSTSPDTFLALRCPSYWREIFRRWEPLHTNEAYQDTPKARCGLYNDALLGSDTDMGTYGTVFIDTADSIHQKLYRQDELRFQQRMCLYVPMGGEVIHNSPLNDAALAIEEMRQVHCTYLNSAYDPNVLEKWRKTPASYSAVWRNSTAYDYIAAHLGYRFRLTECGLEPDLENKDSFRFHFTVINDGFAPCYRRLTAALVLKPDAGDPLRFPIETDTRFWVPGKRVPLSVGIDLHEQQAARYTVCLELRCLLTGKEVSLANRAEKECADMTNPLGELLR